MADKWDQFVVQGGGDKWDQYTAPSSTALQGGGGSPPPAPQSPVLRELNSATPATSDSEFESRNRYRSTYGQDPAPGYPKHIGNQGMDELSGAMMVPTAKALMTAPGALLTSLGAGYGTSRGLKALGVPEWLSDVGGGAASLLTGGLYGKFLPGVMPESLSPSTTKFLNMLPGKNYGDAANEYLGSLHPTTPITPFPAGKGTGTKFGGPTAPTYNPPGTSLLRKGFTPPEGGGFIPQSIQPVEAPPADYKFTPSPKTAKLMNRGGSSAPSTVGVGKAPPTSRWSPPEGGGFSPTTMTPSPNRVSPIVTPTGAAQPATTGAPSSHVLTDISGRTVSVDPDIPEWMGIAQQKSAAVIGRHQYNKSVAMAEQAFGEPGMTPAKIRAMSADKLNAFIQRTMDPRTGRPYSAAEEVLSSGRPGRTTSMIREHAALALEDILRKAGGK